HPFLASGRRPRESASELGGETLNDNNEQVNQPLPDSEMIGATPERVSFDYQVAGLATRGIAQLLDLLILIGILVGLYFAAIAIGAAGADTVAFLLAVIGSFVVIFGYFWTCGAVGAG